MLTSRQRAAAIKLGVAVYNLVASYREMLEALGITRSTIGYEPIIVRQTTGVTTTLTCLACDLTDLPEEVKQEANGAYCQMHPKTDGKA